MHIIVVYNNIFRYAKTVFTGSEITNHSIEYFNPIEYFFFFCRELRKHTLPKIYTDIIITFQLF